MINKLFILLIGIVFTGCVNSGYSESPEVMGDILKVWESQNSDKKSIYYLVKKDLGLYMITVNPFSSDYNPGRHISAKRIENGIRYDNGQGGYYISKLNGDLLVYNKNGELSKAKEIRLKENYQIFPLMSVAVKCPCILQEDSNSLKKLRQDGLPVIAFSCTDDKSNDFYAINSLLTKDTLFTEEEIIQGIIASLDTNKLITYELQYIDFENRIIVDSPNENAKMATLFTQKSTIYITVKSLNALDKKFNAFMDSMIKY